MQPLFLQHVLQKEKSVPVKCCYFCLPQGPKYSIIRETRRGRKYHSGAHGLAAAAQRNPTDRADKRLKTVTLMLTAFTATSSFICQKRTFTRFLLGITVFYVDSVIQNLKWFIRLLLLTCSSPILSLSLNLRINP